MAVFPAIADIRQALVNHLPTIILLDWNMPDGQGNELCRWIRERWNDLPVIYLTVRGDSHDIVTGFQNGTDDYVVKPFDLAVLHSRILALLRRTKSANGTKLFCDDLMLDKEKSAVYYQQKEISVSNPEYQILLILMENKGKTITRRQLLEQVWDNNGTKIENFAYIDTIRSLNDTDSVIYQKANAYCCVPEDTISGEVKSLGGPETLAGNAVSAANGSYMITNM